MTKIKPIPFFKMSHYANPSTSALLYFVPFSIADLNTEWIFTKVFLLLYVLMSFINQISKWNFTPLLLVITHAPSATYWALAKFYFKNLLGRLSKVTDEPIIKIISNPLDIKKGEFTQEELDVVLKKLKIGKLQVLMKYSQNYQKQENLMTYCSDTATRYTSRT